MFGVNLALNGAGKSLGESMASPSHPPCLICFCNFQFHCQEEQSSTHSSSFPTLPMSYRHWVLRPFFFLISIFVFHPPFSSWCSRNRMSSSIVVCVSSRLKKKKVGKVVKLACVSSQTCASKKAAFFYNRASKVCSHPAAVSELIASLQSRLFPLHLVVSSRFCAILAC